MKFKNVTVYIKTVNGDFPIHRNNEYVKYNALEIAHILELKECFFAEIELTDGSVYTVDCDNVKGEFHLTFIDVYCILFNEFLGKLM